MTTQEPDVTECVNTPVIDINMLSTLQESNLSAVNNANAYADPIAAYLVSFYKQPDQGIIERVQQFESSNPRGNRPGFIYAFWDRRDPTDKIKIGRTKQNPRRRISQWDGILGGNNNLVFLFAFRTADNELTEGLIQSTLFYEWLAKEINRRTFKRAVEYYRIDNVAALKLFIRLVVNYVNRLTLDYRASYN